MYVRYLCLFGVYGILSLTLQAQNASAGPTQHLVTSASAPILVDGSKTPDKIPDWLAYRHFIRAISESTGASVEEKSRRESRLAPIGFSKADHDITISALSGAREQLVAFEAQRQIESASPSEASIQNARLDSLLQQEHDYLDGIKASWYSSISVAGRALLDKYIRTQVKSHIVIYGQ